MRRNKWIYICTLVAASVLTLAGCASNGTARNPAEADFGRGGDHGGGFGHDDHGGGGFGHDDHRGPGPNRGMGPVRVHEPIILHGGHGTWRHWDHPVFARPDYHLWAWERVRLVTCTAEDSNGYQYPVTEDGYVGRWANSMDSVEDEALDRCYSESNMGGTCYLSGCTPTYF